jgi:hypothetical protein
MRLDHPHEWSQGSTSLGVDCEDRASRSDRYGTRLHLRSPCPLGSLFPCAAKFDHLFTWHVCLGKVAPVHDIENRAFDSCRLLALHRLPKRRLRTKVLDSHRLRMWRQKEQSGYFLENRLHVYFIWDPRVHARLYHSAQHNHSFDGFTLSQTRAIQRARKEHEALSPSLNPSSGASRGRWRRRASGPGDSRLRTFLKN